MNIDKFLQQKEVAVIGVSSKKKKFGNYVLEKLSSTGYKVFAVNPNAGNNSDIHFYDTIYELNEVSSIVFVTRPDVTNKILKDGIPNKIESVWIQQGAGNHETELILSSMDVDFVFNKCLMMYLNPVTGIHKFHKKIDSFFKNFIN